MSQKSEGHERGVSREKRPSSESRGRGKEHQRCAACALKTQANWQVQVPLSVRVCFGATLPAPAHIRNWPREPEGLERREDCGKQNARGRPPREFRLGQVQTHSTNPLERLNAEVKRRTDVVDIFPNKAAITRLVGALLLGQNDEWQLQRRYVQLEGLQQLTDNQPRGCPL